MGPEQSIATARNWLAESASVAVLTGAGVSAESGVPTFRDAGGQWERFRPEDLASPEAFERDPGFVWQWYDARRGDVAAVAPNAGHTALARLEARVADFTLVTQNVDGLHQAAGSENVHELHGSLWRLRCTACGGEGPDQRVPLPELPPRCSDCGGLLRPAVVWFGEMLPGAVLDAAAAACRRADTVLVAGTSAVVEPAASLPLVGKENGARLVEVNPEATPLSGEADVSLRGTSAGVLPDLIP